MNPITTIIPCTNCGCGPVTCYRLWEVTLNCSTGQFGALTDMQQVMCTTPPSLNWTLFVQTTNTCRMRRWHAENLGPPPLPTQAQIYALCSCANCTEIEFGYIYAVAGIAGYACHSAVLEFIVGPTNKDRASTTSPNGNYYVPWSNGPKQVGTNGSSTYYDTLPFVPLPDPGAPVSCENFSQVITSPLELTVAAGGPFNPPRIGGGQATVFVGGTAASITVDRCSRVKTLLFNNTITQVGGQVLCTVLYPGDLA
jgi:hypothetical protein